VSRRLERAGPTGVVLSTFTDVLGTPPAGHKYEVLEVRAYIVPHNGGALYVLVDFDSAGLTIVGTDLNAGADWSPGRQFSGLVLYPGDELQIYTAGTYADNCTCWVSYVDVDFT